MVVVWLWNTGEANALAGIGSFVLGVPGAIAGIAGLLTQLRSNAATESTSPATRVQAQVALEPVKPKAGPLSDYLLHVDETGTAPRVSQVPDAQLGVRSAVRQAEFGPTPYLERDIDEVLTTAMRAGGMVVLYGPATAGKSRTATALLKRLFGDRHLYVPAEVGSLRALLDSGHQPQDAVVWLDNLEEYLGDRGIDRAVLSRLCPPGRGDVTVVATLRYEEYRKHGLETGAVQSEDEKQPHPAGTALLRELKNQGRLFSLAADLSATERAGIARTQADARSGDTRLSEAAESDRGFGEHLGAGEEMMQRWIGCGNTLEKLGAAYISAAVDARRAGYHGPIPTKDLAELADGYLPENLRNRGNLPTPRDAVTWATQPVVGTETSSCLILHRSGGYRAEDYLIDRADTPPSPLAGKPIHDAIWSTVLSLADLEHLNAIGLAAHLTGNYDVAHTAWRRAAHAGDTEAMLNLGNVLHDLGDIEQAETWYHKAINAGHTNAMLNLGNLLDDRGDIEQAETWYHKAINAGHTNAMLNLGNLLRAQGHTTQAETWYHKAIEAGDTGAMSNLGVLFHKRGNTQQAETWYHRAIEAGDTGASFNLGVLFCEQGDTEQAETWWRKTIDAGNTNAMFHLGNLLRIQGHTTEAETWYRNAIEAGHTKAMLNLGVLLHDQGDPEGAETWYRNAIEAGHTKAMLNLGVLLHDQGDPEGAETWYRNAIEAGHTKAMLNLGVLLHQRGSTELSASWFRKAADAGDANAIKALWILSGENEGGTDTSDAGTPSTSSPPPHS